MFASHRFLKSLRLIHLYLGVFTAPMLLFFAITGGLQTFSLHERTRGSDYAPPAWLATMAELHKKQNATPPQHKSPGPEAASAERHANADGAGKAPDGAAAKPSPGNDHPANMPVPKEKNLLPMKIFFAFVALGLLTSTLTGLYMAYKYTRHKGRITLVLLGGIVVPLLLILL